jgi:polyphosphate kinase 2 (PPK2 family)
MEAYEDTIRHTASKHAPWYVVPADNKWFTRLVVASAIVTNLDALDLDFPTLDEEGRKALAEAKQALA